MGAIASQITSLAIVYSTVYFDADQRKHQSSASLASAQGIHRGPVNSPHKWPVTRKMFSFDDVIMWKHLPRYWPFVRGIHRSPANSPHKGQWRRALMFSLICVCINGWVNNREAGDLRRNRPHYDVSIMFTCAGRTVPVDGWVLVNLQAYWLTNFEFRIYAGPALCAGCGNIRTAFQVTHVWQDWWLSHVLVDFGRDLKLGLLAFTFTFSGHNR